MTYRDSSAPEHEHRPPRRILLVEDHPAMREAVAELIDSDEELDVVAAFESAEEALELIGSGRAPLPVDVAVVDLNLPGMHGLQLVSELDRRARIPVIVLSSHSSERFGPVALDAGASAYVEKIRTAWELVETVREVLHLPSASARRHPRAAAFEAANRNHRLRRETDPASRHPTDDGFDLGATHRKL